MKVKPRLKSDVEIGRSVREKSLVLKKTAKPEGGKGSEEDEYIDEMGSINLEEAMPGLPSNLISDSSNDGYKNKTLEASNRTKQEKSNAAAHNLEHRKQARNYDELSS